MDVNSLPKTVTRQRRGCDLNPGLSAPESSTLPLGYRDAEDSVDLTARRTLELAHQGAAPDRGRSQLSTAGVSAL